MIVVAVTATVTAVAATAVVATAVAATAATVIVEFVDSAHVTPTVAKTATEVQAKQMVISLVVRPLSVFGAMTILTAVRKTKTDEDGDDKMMTIS